MRKILLIFLLILSINTAFSKTADSKNFPVSVDSMFMITLASLSELNLEIKEMQTTSGYILFKTPSGDEYLVMVSKAGLNLSNVKISKLKNSSPLSEIQGLIYDTLSKNISYPPSKVQL